MTIGNIKKIISEMIADLKLKKSMASCKYDFYLTGEEAFNHAKEIIRLDKKIDILNSIDIDKLDINLFERIEEFIIQLKKEDYFSETDIDCFINICCEIW